MTGASVTMRGSPRARDAPECPRHGPSSRVRWVILGKLWGINLAGPWPNRTIGPYHKYARAGSELGAEQDNRGCAVDQSLELIIWLGMAVLALSAAYILLWRTRRVLSQSRQDALVQEVRLAPPAVLAPSAVTESASSVRAS